MSKALSASLLFVSLFTISLALGAETSKGGIPSKGNAFNPDISANFLGLFQTGNKLSSDRNVIPHQGLSLQEAELQFSAAVDPYVRAVALFAVAQESGAPDYKIEPEEVYLETLSLPYVTLRTGKFKMAFGKHNLLHSHAYPFINAPIIHSELLGDEGLNEVGVSGAILFPTSWFSELTLQSFTLSNATLFQSPRSGDMGGLAHLKNLWDLSDDLTLELGLSGTMGKNQYEETASAWGSDLTVKWRPATGGKYHSLAWTTEYLDGNRKGKTDPTTGASQEHLSGLATWLQYQFAERWWIQGRYETLGIARSDAATQPTQQKQSALLGFFPSEFSGLRAQYDHLTTEGVSEAEHIFSLQYNVSIGAHPAHAY